MHHRKTSQQNWFTEKDWVQCVNSNFCSAFLQCSFNSAWCWKTMIDVRGRKIVLVHFVGNCLLAMDIASVFFQVMYHIKVWINWCLCNYFTSSVICIGLLQIKLLWSMLFILRFFFCSRRNTSSTLATAICWTECKWNTFWEKLYEAKELH